MVLTVILTGDMDITGIIMVTTVLDMDQATATSTASRAGTTPATGIRLRDMSGSTETTSTTNVPRPSGTKQATGTTNQNEEWVRIAKPAHPGPF